MNERNIQNKMGDAFIDLTKGARIDFGKTYVENKIDKLVQENERANKSFYKRFKEIILWPGSKGELEEITGESYKFIKPRKDFSVEYSIENFKYIRANRFFSFGESFNHVESAYQSLNTDTFAIYGIFPDAMIHFREIHFREVTSENLYIFVQGVPVIKSKKVKK